MADTISRTWESLVHNRKKRILFIVDDDPSALYYTGMLLQRLDYSVYTTRMAEEVLEIVKFAVPLLILTEVNLGGMDGITFLKRIKKDPKTASVPVIVYTASADPSLKHSCQESGCSVFSESHSIRLSSMRQFRKQRRKSRDGTYAFAPACRSCLGKTTGRNARRWIA